MLEWSKGANKVRPVQNDKREHIKQRLWKNSWIWFIKDSINSINSQYWYWEATAKLKEMSDCYEKCKN